MLSIIYLTTHLFASINFPESGNNKVIDKSELRHKVLNVFGVKIVKTREVCFLIKKIKHTKLDKFFKKTYFDFINEKCISYAKHPAKILILCTIYLRFKISLPYEFIFRENDNTFIDSHKLMVYIKSNKHKDLMITTVKHFLRFLYKRKNFYSNETITIDSETHSLFSMLENEDIKNFNYVLYKFTKKYITIFGIAWKNYCKVRELKNYENFKNTYLFFIHSITSCKDFFRLKKFLPSLKELFLELNFQNMTDHEVKRLHFILSEIVLKFKTTTNILFEKNSDLFTKQFLPKYKLEILKNIFFDLHLSLYLITIIYLMNDDYSNSIIIGTFNLFLMISKEFPDSSYNYFFKELQKEELNQYKVNFIKYFIIKNPGKSNLLYGLKHRCFLEDLKKIKY